MTTSTAPAISLRGYQRDAIDAVHRAWSGATRGTGAGVASRAAVVLPTGAGKTVIFAHPDFREPIIGAGTQRGRMLILVHRDELAVQTVAKIRAIDPGASVGRVQNVWDETDAQIIVASVQTLARAGRRDRIQDVGLIVVDEAHHAVAPTYLQILDHFGAFRAAGPVPTAGFSATLQRAEEDKHLGDVWQEVVLRRDVVDGIRAGWLVDVHGKQVKLAGLDLRDVKRTRGDYSDGDLGEHLRAADAPDQVAEAYVELAKDRQGIAFWPDVATAEVGAEALAANGIPAATVLGSTPSVERAAIYEAYRRGALQVISSCMVLTEGFDMPQASCAVIARPTQSAPLYVQMAGRVLRPHHLPVPGFGRKSDALILDVVGVTGRHKLATLADLSVTIKAAPEDGVSLAEQAELDAAAEVDTDALGNALRLDGEPAGGIRVVKDVDLFSESASLWLQTPGGTNFIPAGDWTVFLWPQPDTLWTIGVTPTKGVPGQATPVMTGLTLEWAMEQAERYADGIARRATLENRGANLSRRGAAWRKSGPASDAQIRFAASLGLRFEPGARKADVSDAISVALATRALGG